MPCVVRSHLHGRFSPLQSETPPTHPCSKRESETSHELAGMLCSSFVADLLLNVATAHLHCSAGAGGARSIVITGTRPCTHHGSITCSLLDAGDSGSKEGDCRRSARQMICWWADQPGRQLAGKPSPVGPPCQRASRFTVLHSFSVEVEAVDARSEASLNSTCQPSSWANI